MKFSFFPSQKPKVSASIINFKEFTHEIDDVIVACLNRSSEPKEILACLYTASGSHEKYGSKKS